MALLLRFFIPKFYSMNELIKVTEKDGKQVVSARELYKFLQLADGQFARWAKSNIIDNPYGIENEDWVGFDIDVEGNKTVDFALVVTFAKKISMTAKSERGNEIRDYFIECEKRANSAIIQLPNFNNPAEAARAWALEYEAKQQALLEAKEAKDNVKRLIHDVKTYTSGEIAKELGMRSAIELNKALEKMGVQFKQNGTWLLYAKYADLDYTSTKQIVLDNGHITYDRRWTGRGRDFIVSLFRDEENIQS